MSSCSNEVTSRTLDVPQEVIFLRLSELMRSPSFLQTMEGAGWPLKAQLMVAVLPVLRSRSFGLMVNRGAAVRVSGERREWKKKNVSLVPNQ